MAKRKYIPDQGDIVWLDFNPQMGKEIMKKRPALVLSPMDYNKHGLMIAVPITSQIKQYPFEVKISGEKIKGVALADSMKNLDWQARQVEFIEKTTKTTLLEVLKLIGVLLKPVWLK